MGECAGKIPSIKFPGAEVLYPAIGGPGPIAWSGAESAVTLVAEDDRKALNETQENAIQSTEGSGLRTGV